MKLVPFFELNGTRYEIKRTRYILAEYDRLGEESQLSNEDKENAIKAQGLMADIQKYAEKTQELEDRYFETLDDEDERKYLKMKALRDKSLQELARLEAETGSTNRLQKAGVDLLEKIVIKALAEQYFNFDEQKAQSIWEQYVDTVSNKQEIVEWLSAMSECLFNEEDEVEDTSFLAQMRKRSEERAKNRRKANKR